MGSVGRLRILKYLARNPEREASLSIYRLKVLTGLGGSSLKAYLRSMIRHGFVREVEINHERKYALNRDNPAVQHLIRLFESAGYI